MTAPDLAAIRARVEAARPGPWAAGDGIHFAHGVYRTEFPAGLVFEGPRADDSEFVAHAREDVPALLALVDSLTAERDAPSHRLFPGQGEEYANEVERQRVVIHQFQHAVRGLTAERDLHVAIHKVDRARIDVLTAENEALTQDCDCEHLPDGTCLAPQRQARIDAALRLCVVDTRDETPAKFQQQVIGILLGRTP